MGGQEKPARLEAAYRKLKKVYVGENRESDQAFSFPGPREGWAAAWAKVPKPLSGQLLGVPFRETKLQALFRLTHPHPRIPL